MRAINWIWSTIAILAVGIFWPKKCDLVYAGPSEILPISLAALIVGRLRGVPVVLCNQNVRGTELWSVNRIVHRAADAIVTVSDALAAELRREGIRQQIFIGTNGVDDFSISPQAPRYDGVFVARHTVEKGVFDLFKIWRLVCDNRPAAKLACVGFVAPNTVRPIQMALQNLALERNVELLGPVEEAEKWRIYSASRVCVFPSLVEGWGIVPIEAHLAGLPVVAYDLAAYRHTIAGSPGTRLIPIGDLAGFARATLGMLSAESRNRAALQSFGKRFTWEAAATREERILRDVLKIARSR